MARQTRMIGDYEAREARNSEVLHLYFDEGVKPVEIARRLKLTKSNVDNIIDRGRPRDADGTPVELALRKQKIFLYYAMGLSTAENAQFVGMKTPSEVDHYLERHNEEYAEYHLSWRASTRTEGFAQLDARVGMLHRDLAYLEEEVDEMEWVSVHDSKLKTNIHKPVPTGRKLQRKWEQDKYGRPLWGRVRAQLMGELGKLMGDYKQPLTYLNLNKAATELIMDVNQGAPQIASMETKLELDTAAVVEVESTTVDG